MISYIQTNSLHEFWILALFLIVYVPSIGLCIGLIIRYDKTYNPYDRSEVTFTRILGVIWPVTLAGFIIYFIVKNIQRSFYWTVATYKQLHPYIKRRFMAHKVKRITDKYLKQLEDDE